MSTDTDTGTDNFLALLVIDNEPIRRQLELELQIVREAIEGCEEEINRHESLDLPAFRKWMAIECADLLSERRSVEEKIWGLRARLSAIQGLTQHGIKNVAAAFFWFQEIEHDRLAIPPYVKRAWEEVTVGRPSKRKTGGVESGRFNEGPEGDDDEGFVDWSEEAGGAVPLDDVAGGSEPEREDSRHKSLFRKIALLLHPDRAGVLTKQELELWYQAQQAYAEKDVIALETILARCDRVGTNSRTLSELRAFVRQANARLATLQQSVAILAEAPSWHFLILSSIQLKDRLREVRKDLQGIIRGLSHEATSMENELARIAERAKRWTRRRKGEEKQLALEI
jgi:hypothetical protein